MASPTWRISPTALHARGCTCWTSRRTPSRPCGSSNCSGCSGSLAARGDVQFIIATHSPLLLALPEAEIFSFDAGPIRQVSYEDTDYYRIYRDFLNNPKQFLDDDESPDG